MTDMMVEFRLKGPMNNRLPNVGKETPGETVYLKVSGILCLFPDHRQIRTMENDWTIEVYEDDWPKVERAFRFMYMGNRVTAQGSE